mmetsp:Transcript_34733/g.88235  ORF Transcript_34733/g.88235 Transcript_34733/m.88235 type:complete len:91 (-) Transcript_34733:12-284(-)
MRRRAVNAKIGNDRGRMSARNVSGDSASPNHHLSRSLHPYQHASLTVVELAQSAVAVHRICDESQQALPQRWEPRSKNFQHWGHQRHSQK